VKRVELSKNFATKVEQETFTLPDFNPAATEHWIRTQSRIPALLLDIDIPFQAILAEVKQLSLSMFTDHRDGEEHQGWSSFVIHGADYTATKDETSPMSWTAEAEQYLPTTVRYFKESWPGNSYDRVRVMLLKPGGIITLHTDYELPGELGPINIALNQPTNCNFYMKSFGIVPFNAGDAWMLNVANHHTVINNSNENRYHIIVHQNNISNDLANLVKVSYNRLYAS
jgi:hypothetical protein